MVGNRSARDLQVNDASFEREEEKKNEGNDAHNKARELSLCFLIVSFRILNNLISCSEASNFLSKSSAILRENFLSPVVGSNF